MRKIQRSSQSSHDDNDRSQSRDHIPIDLIVEILSRLPAKSIGRYRSVSMLWSSITTTPGFINSFPSRSSASSRPCVLLILSKRDKLFVFSSPLHKKTDPDQAESYQFTIPNNGYLRRYDSVHGLIYLESSTEFTIWNPAMKRFFTLPKPEGSDGRCSKGFLGYDPIDCKYKALCMLTCDKIGILTLGTQESWRILSEGFPKHWYRTGSELCINRVMYYNCYFEKPPKFAIMSFDLRSENFSLIKYPMEEYCPGSLFVSYEGRLSLIISSIDDVELWILEDNHQWVNKHFPSPNLPYTRWMMKEWTLKGVTDIGEFIYIYTPNATYRSPTELPSANWSLYEWFHIVYFDPKRNSLREVKFPGIAYDDFSRLGEVGYDLMKDLSVVPNHIESLMSL